MKCKPWATLILLIPIIVSCSVKTNEQSKNLITIDLESNIKNFKSLKLSEVASTIEYIPLSSSPGFFLKAINGIDINDNYILVSGVNGVGLFDKHGTFITKIGKQGHGPGEWQVTGKSYFLNDYILVPSVIGKPNIFVYDLSGAFIKACYIPQHYISPVYSNWLPVSQEEFLLQVPNTTGDQDFRIIKADCKGKVLKGFTNSTKFKPFNPGAFSTDSQAGQFYIFDDKVRYKEVRNDTVWELSNNKLNPCYILYRGKFGSDVDFRSKAAGKLSVDDLRINQIVETPKFLFFETLFSSIYPFNFYMGYIDIAGKNRPFPILGVYEKVSGDTYFVKPSNFDNEKFPAGIPTGIQNDIDGGINFFPKHYASDSMLVSWIDAYKLIEYAASEAFRKNKPLDVVQKQKFIKLVNNLELNDNHVLLVIKLKQ